MTGLLTLICGVLIIISLTEYSVFSLACQYSVPSPAKYKLLQHTDFSQIRWYIP